MKVHLAVPCVVYSYFFTEQAFYCVFSLFSLVVLRFVTEEPLNKPALSVNAKERPKGLVFQADSAEFTWLVRNKTRPSCIFLVDPNLIVKSILFYWEIRSTSPFLTRAPESILLKCVGGFSSSDE